MVGEVCEQRTHRMVAEPAKIARERTEVLRKSKGAAIVVIRALVHRLSSSSQQGARPRLRTVLRLASGARWGQAQRTVERRRARSDQDDGVGPRQRWLRAPCSPRGPCSPAPGVVASSSGVAATRG
jgi:hypothetical protein